MANPKPVPGHKHQLHHPGDGHRVEGIFNLVWFTPQILQLENQPHTAPKATGSAATRRMDSPFATDLLPMQVKKI